MCIFVMWDLWKERNHMIFQRKERNQRIFQSENSMSLTVTLHVKDDMEQQQHQVFNLCKGRT